MGASCVAPARVSRLQRQEMVQAGPNKASAPRQGISTIQEGINTPARHQHPGKASELFKKASVLNMHVPGMVCGVKACSVAAQ